MLFICILKNYFLSSEAEILKWDEEDWLNFNWILSNRTKALPPSHRIANGFHVSHVFVCSCWRGREGGMRERDKRMNIFYLGWISLFLVMLCTPCGKLLTAPGKARCMSGVPSTIVAIVLF